MFDCLCTNQDGLKVIRGTAEVLAPTEKIKRPRVALPEVTISDRDLRYQHLMSLMSDIPPITMAVVHPCDAASLGGALAARDRDLIVPTLVGPVDKIRSVAAQANLDLTGCAMVDVPHSHAAAARAVAMARDGEVKALMKGSLHTGRRCSRG